MWRWTALETLWQDARFAVRMMRRTPGFTLVAVLSLALGIGANTAIFSLINTLMLRMLPVSEPQQLVEFLQEYPGEPRGNGYWSRGSFEYFRDQSRVFSGITAATPPARSIVREDGLEPETVSAEYVAGNFFPTLGVEPALGRLIGPEDIRAGSAPAAVLSWAYWKSRFNLDPSILGKRIVVQDAPVTVVGVTQPAFFGLQVGYKTDLWLASPATTSLRFYLIARLKPAASIQQARAEMAVLYQFTIDERAKTSKDPLIQQLNIEVEPAGAGLSRLRDVFAQTLLVLMAVVVLLLLIACTSVASLSLARGAARHKEMAVRVSLGASRTRLVCQAFTEALLLSATGSVIGVGIAYFGANALVRILTSGRQMAGMPQDLDIAVRPDVHLLLFTIGIALLTGLLFGLAPAWNAFRSAPASSMREMGWSAETRFGRRFGKSLVVAQAALSVVLLSTAGLFTRNLADLKRLDLGFRRDHVLLATVDPSRSGYTPERLAGAYQELLRRLRSIPGVRSASLSAPTPLSGAGASGFVNLEGFEERAQDRRYVSLSWVAPEYFETLGTPLLAGRDFNFQDEKRPGVAIINQSMARFYFANHDPIGKRITLDHVTGDSAVRTYEIVGVVGDAKYYQIREPVSRAIYLPAFQNGRVTAQNFVLRTNIDPKAVEGDVRRTVRDVLRTIPVARVKTLSDQIDASIVPERLIATLSGLFGGLGLLLAAIGLYGLLAYTVTRRVTEFGIRLALGASTGTLIRMVLSDALTLVSAGLIFGTPVALLGTRLARRYVADLPQQSIVPVVFGVLAMLAVALLAAFLPAGRAARVDPMEVLRHE